jgi:hypothetical protein
MNSLADLLIQLNRERLPDDYIIQRVDEFIKEMKLEFQIEEAVSKLEIEEDEVSVTVFCHCETPEDRMKCPDKKTCISY